MTLSCAKNGHPEPSAPVADTILVGGHIYSGSLDATSVALAGGKIVGVGDAAAMRGLAGEETEIIELDGAWVLPGLVDAHAHLLSLGATLMSVDLVGTTSYDEVLARVKAAADAQPEGWILGRGWDQNDWKADASGKHAFPQGARLEEVAPGRLVLLSRIDGHAVLASPAALREAGVTQTTKDPDGGKILRAKDGTPTGVLVDNAISLVSERVPEPTDAVRRQQLDRALEVAAAVGLTGIHDMGVGADTLALYREYARDGKLTLRIYAALRAGEPSLADFYAKGPVTDDFVTVRAVKFFIDGALGSRGAALKQDYSDDPGNRGLLLMSQADLEKGVRAAVDAGFQPCVHAIGDRGNRVVLDTFKNAGAAAGDMRPRIEHAQIIDVRDLPRFAAEDVIASMQPTHATSDMPWAEERLGPERIAGAYAWRRLLDEGTALAFGSDFPVERPHPLEGLYAAVTRMDKQGAPKGGWTPDQKLTFDEALSAFTEGAAYASFAESRRGRIAVGFDADLTIVSSDLDPDEPESYLSAHVVRTIVAGRTVYEP